MAWGSEVRVTDTNRKTRGGRRSVEDLEGVTVSVGQEKREVEEGTDRRRASQPATRKCNSVVMWKESQWWELEGKVQTGSGEGGEIRKNNCP